MNCWTAFVLLWLTRCAARRRCTGSGTTCAQALFEAAFRADVAELDKSLEKMIWRIMARLADLAGAALSLQSSVLCAAFDGLFQQCLLKHLSGDARAITALQKNVRLVVGQWMAMPRPAS